MTIRAILIRVWQGKPPLSIQEFISLLESGADTDTLIDVLSLLSEKRISVNKAEEMLGEAKAQAEPQRR